MNDRILYIGNKCKLSYSNGHLIIDNGTEKKRIHLDSISSICIETTEVTLTSYLVAELTERDIQIVFCNKKKLPVGSIIPCSGTSNTSLRVSEQILWNKERKDEIWQKIVTDKLSSQSRMIKGAFDENMEVLPVNPGDPENREAVFAKTYFKKMFGPRFVRHLKDRVNDALNYGYTILISEMSRIVASHGYINQIGIHHKSGSNSFNLACDLVEPFRPLVDFVVYVNSDEILDKEYKLRLISVLNDTVEYKGLEYSVKEAMDLYFMDSVKSLKSENMYMGNLKIC